MRPFKSTTDTENRARGLQHVRVLSVEGTARVVLTAHLDTVEEKGQIASRDYGELRYDIEGAKRGRRIVDLSRHYKQRVLIRPPDGAGRSGAVQRFITVLLGHEKITHMGPARGSQFALEYVRQVLAESYALV